MSYAAIVFDMDGVLLPGRATPESVYRRAAEEVVRDFGVTVETDQDWNWLTRPRSSVRFRAVCERVGLPAEAAWGYREAVATRYENDRINGGERTPFADANVLSQLAANHNLGIVSNNRHGTVRHCVERFDWDDAVDVYRGRFPTLVDFDRKKPDPTYLQWALERLPDGPILFVGDRESDLTTATRAGIDAVLLDRDGTADPPPETRAIASLTEVPTTPPTGT